MKKKLTSILLATTMFAAMITGCSSNTSEESTNEDATTESTDTADTKTSVETADATNETSVTGDDESSENVILVVSFGTSYNDSRELTIGGIEEAIAEAYPEYEVRRAFTSQTIIDKLAERDGIEIDNVEEALDRAVDDGVKNLVVQPTHLMDGYEYTDLADALTEYEDKFESVSLGAPLLTSDEDIDALITALVNKMSDYDDGQTAICFMGHGTEADSNAIYQTLQDRITELGYENYYIGTVEATPSVDDVLEQVQANSNYTKVVLEPLMVVAGDHANNDMAGDEDDSWKSIFENAGYEVECILEGLGQVEDVQNIYVSHVQDAIDNL